MKTILVLFTLLMVAADLYIPRDSVLRALAGQPSQLCTITYNEEHEGYIFEDSSACSQVEIVSLPPLTEGDVQIKARFVKGSYTLRRALSVGVEVGYSFEIEDMLTGQSYNLKSETPYTFNVSRIIPDRFVMHVKKEGGVTSK